jgi:hypothetical protein
MSNSMIVSVRKLPLSLSEVQQAFNRAFNEFGLAAPDVQVHDPESPPKPLSNSILTVRGAGPHEHCWISFGEYPTELTGSDANTHMGSVTTRGSWLFASVVVLGLFAFGGSTAFNDSGELDGRPEYDEEALRQAISAGLASGNHYLAR